MKIFLLFVLLAVGLADPCRSTAPSYDDCKIHRVADCLQGQIIWPYPMSTCQFAISIKSDKTYANIALRQPSRSWKINDRQGRELDSGVGSFNRTVVEVTNGIVVTLTFPDEVSFFIGTLTYHFFD